MISDWQDKTTVVTGGAGFLGSYVVANLAKRGCREIIVPRSRDYDLRLHQDVCRLYNDSRPDIAIHLAAVVGGIGANKASPAEFFYNNLIMGLLLMEQARQFEVAKFVAVGTICAYPKNTPVPFREENIWAGYPEETNAPYGLAKKMLLVQGQAYREQFGTNSIYLLPTNLYGPRDNFDLETSHVIPAIIRKCQTAIDTGSSQVHVWGDGTVSREFLHVSDAAEGILLAAEKYDGAEPVNLGTGMEITIRDLARSIGSIMGFKGEFVWDRVSPNGQPRRCLDVSRASQLFGFSAAIDLQQGLRETIDWYRETRPDLQEKRLTDGN